MPIETILLAIGNQDDNRIEQVTDTALELARPLDATVVIGHAIPEDEDGIPNSAVPIVGSHHPYVLSQNEYDELLNEYSFAEDNIDDVVAKHELVQVVADRLTDSGVDYQIRGVTGDASEALVTLADEIDADHLIISGSRRSPTEKVVFGSVVQTVLLESPCPVTFVQGD